MRRNRWLSTLVCTVVCTLVAVAVPIAAHGDEYTDHLARAATRLENEELAQALLEYRAAYALKQQPEVLRTMACIERRLGHMMEAADLYRRWLVSGEGTEAERDEAQKVLAAIEALRPATPVGGLNLVIPQQPSRYELRPRSGLIAGGSVLFSAGYLAAAFAGGPIAASSDNYSYCNDPQYSSSSDCNKGDMRVAGGLLYIPFVGPLVSSIAYRDLAWGMSWSFVDAPMQIGGLVMMIAGQKYKKAVPIFDKVQFAPYASASGGGISVAGKF